MFCLLFFLSIILLWDNFFLYRVICTTIFHRHIIDDSFLFCQCALMNTELNNLGNKAPSNNWYLHVWYFEMHFNASKHINPCMICAAYPSFGSHALYIIGVERGFDTLQVPSHNPSQWGPVCLRHHTQTWQFYNTTDHNTTNHHKLTNNQVCNQKYYPRQATY